MIFVVQYFALTSKNQCLKSTSNSSTGDAVVLLNRAQSLPQPFSLSCKKSPSQFLPGYKYFPIYHLNVHLSETVLCCNWTLCQIKLQQCWSEGGFYLCICVDGLFFSILEMWFRVLLILTVLNHATTFEFSIISSTNNFCAHTQNFVPFKTSKIK